MQVTLNKDQFAFMVISHLVLLRMRNVSDKRCIENQNISYKFNNSPHPAPSENSAVYEIMWENNVDSDRLQMTIWRMRIACSITKATNTHSEYVIVIGFPLQRQLNKRPSMLRNTYFACPGFTETLTLYKTQKCTLWSESITFEYCTLCGRKLITGILTFRHRASSV